MAQSQLRTTVVLSAVLLALTACGLGEKKADKRAAEAAAAAKQGVTITPGPDTQTPPCNLLTAAEVAGAAGGKAGPGVVSGEATAASCEWTVVGSALGEPGHVTIFLIPDVTTVDALKAYASRERLDEVSNANGDYVYSSEITATSVVFHDGKALQLNADFGGGADAAGQVTVLKKLANDALGRM